MSAIRRRSTGHPLRRMWGLFLRHYYVSAGSWTRLVEMIYWPTVQVVIWGFITEFLYTNSSFVARAFGVLLAGALLWDILFRGQLGVAVSFLEEIWSRNLAQLFTSPLRPAEYIASLMALSLVRTLLGLIPAAALASAFFGFNVAELGLSLIAFFFNLIVMGWAIAMVVCGLVLRYGLGAENLAWALMFALAPVCGIYYPISVLPEWLQAVSTGLPASYVFEGMRAVLVDKTVRFDLMAQAAALNLVYLVVGIGAFVAFFRNARIRGQLVHVGE